MSTIECNFIFYFDNYVVCPSVIDVEFTVSKDDFTNIKIIVLYRSLVWISLLVFSGVRVLSTFQDYCIVLLTLLVFTSCFSRVHVELLVFCTVFCRSLNVFYPLF